MQSACEEVGRRSVVGLPYPRPFATCRRSHESESGDDAEMTRLLSASSSAARAEAARAGARQGCRAWLAGGEGRVYDIDLMLCLGRSRENDCRLPDQDVSRRHAVVKRDETGVCCLQDLNSTNGTFLNGVRIEEVLRLREGDQIRIGPFELVYHESVHGKSERSPTTLIPREDCRRENRWLLLADIEGATGFLKKNGTETYLTRLDQWLGNSQLIIDRHHGSVYEYVGDGFFAWWPDKSGIEAKIVDSLKVLRAEERNGPFTFRLVLHFAEVLIAGHSAMHKECLCGEPVYFLFRLEKVASRLAKRELFSREAGDRLRSLLPDLSEISCEVPDFGECCLFCWSSKGGSA